MKKKILLLISIFLVVNFDQDIFAWCFVREDIDFTVNSSNKCLDVEVIKTCQQYKLKIKSNCNNIYYLEDGEWKPKEINKYHPTNHRLKIINIEKWFTVYDFVEYEVWKWEKKLNNINDEKDIIYIKGRTYSKYNISKNIILYKIEALFLVIVLMILLIYFYKRQRNKKVEKNDII